MIIALSVIRALWMSIDDVRTFMTYMISSDVSVCSADDFKGSKSYHMYSIALKLIMTLWLRVMLEAMRKRKVHHEQNERSQTLQHLEDASWTSWSDIEHESSILAVQPCGCWMIEIRPWEDRKSLLRSCSRVSRVCLKRLKSGKKCREVFKNSYVIVCLIFDRSTSIFFVLFFAKRRKSLIVEKFCCVRWSSAKHHDIFDKSTNTIEKDEWLTM